MAASDEWSIFGPRSAPGILPTMQASVWRDLTPYVQVRTKPDGTKEFRPKPGSAAPGLFASGGKEEKADTSLDAVAGETVKTFGTALARNITSMPGQVEEALSLPMKAVKRLAGQKAEVPLVTEKGDLGRLSRKVSGLHQRQTERLAGATSQLPIPVAVGLDAAAELGAGLADPTNLPVGAAASRVPRAALAEEAMAARVAGRTPGVLEALAESAALRGERGSIDLPGGGDRRLNAGMRQEVQDAIERVRGLSEEERQALMASPDLDRPTEIALERVAFTERAGTFHGPPEMGTAAPPRRAPGPGLPPKSQLPGRPGGAQAPLEAAAKVPSTRGVTNVSGVGPELEAVADANRGALDTARGGTRPVSIYHDAKALADETGLTMEDFLQTPAGRTWNDREMALGRSYLGGLREKIKAAADQVATGALDPAVARTAMAEDQAKLTRLLVSLQVHGATPAGRALRSLQETVDPFSLAAGPSDKLTLALTKRYAEHLDDDTIARISQLSPDHPEDLVSFLRTMERPKFRDYAASYWYGSVLSGPKTLLRNTIGNAVKLAADTGMRVVEAPAEQAIARLQGRPPEKYMREVVPATVGLFKGLPKGIQRFTFIMANGYDPDRLIEDIAGKAAKFDTGSELPLDAFTLSENRGVRALGGALNYGPRVLSATDALFKSMAESSERYAWATRKAIQEGSGDVGGRAAQLLIEQPEEMVDAARAFAKKATYQDPMSAIGRWASAGRKVIPFGDKLMPFVHVSDRVAAAVTDFIPGAKPGKAYRLLRDQSPEAAELIARQAVGGALGMLGLSWAAQGKLTGEAPKDEKARNDFYAEGRQPYSVLLGGQWVPMRDALGPLAGPFVAAAALHDHFQADPGGMDVQGALEASGGMVLSTAKYMLDASYLQTLQDVIASVEEQKGDAGKGLTQAGTRAVGGYLPWSGAERSIAAATDTGERGAPRVVQKPGAVEELKSGIPGLRRDLDQRVDVLGQGLETSTGTAGVFNPMQPSANQIADSQLEENVQRLRFTLQQRRREFSRGKERAESQVKTGRPERAAETRAAMPPMSDPTAFVDSQLDAVRELEDRVRRLRANRLIQPAQRQALEIQLQQRMQQIMETALGRLSPGQAAAPPSSTPADEWSIFAPR